MLAKSGKAVETAGDIDTLLLDKTGTITVGNRHATEFIPVGRYSAQRSRATRGAVASAVDETPEGQEHRRICRDRSAEHVAARIAYRATRQFVAFSAQTRMSGIDLPSGLAIRKGAPDAVIRSLKAAKRGQRVPSPELNVSEAGCVDSQRSGATPLAVAYEGPARMAVGSGGA